MTQTTYVVRTWYNDGYDADGVMNHVDEAYDDYEAAKGSYAYSLNCKEDAYEVELIKRVEDHLDFTMASSRRSCPRRIVIEEDWVEPEDD